MTDTRNECYSILPPVDWESRAKHREARRLAVDDRNARIAAGGAAAAVAVVGGGSIGGAKTKEAKKA